MWNLKLLSIIKKKKKRNRLTEIKNKLVVTTREMEGEKKKMGIGD